MSKVGLLFSYYPLPCQLAIALFSGILMGLTPAPVNAWFLAWIALAPLWVLIIKNSEFNIQTGRRKGASLIFNSEFFLGLAWGIGYHGFALSWIMDLHPLTWMGVPWLGSVAIALFVWMFITLWGAIVIAIWARVMAQFWILDFRFWHPSTLNPQPSILPTWLRILIGTASWCTLETLLSYGSLHWTSLSFSQSPHNLAILHLGQLSGPMTVTAAIVVVNGMLAEAWIQFKIAHEKLRARNLLIFNFAFLIGLHLIGFELYSRPLIDLPQASLKVGIVQGNVPTRIKLFEEGLRRSLQSYTTGYQTLADQNVDVVLTPEGALPWFWVGTPYQEQTPLYQTILERGVTAWVGTLGMQQDRVTQTLFTITGEGRIVSRYNKVKLVPLGEYIPFESLLGGLITRLSPVKSTMISGDPNQRFDTPFGRAIVGICYESAFAELFRNQAAAGGQFILTASNNDPYGQAMMAQHHAQDTMRAIETDRWAARATNTGLSGIIDPHGRTQWMSKFRTYETHAHMIYRRRTKTLYVRWGNWLTPVLLILALGGYGMQSLKQ
jgi:apolipoprotein N-acyltransferase